MPPTDSASWWPVFALAAFVLSQAFRADTKPRWLTLPARIQPYGAPLAAICGALATTFDDRGHGLSWQVAAMHALTVLVGVPALAFVSPSVTAPAPSSTETTKETDS